MEEKFSMRLVKKGKVIFAKTRKRIPLGFFKVIFPKGYPTIQLYNTNSSLLQEKNYPTGMPIKSNFSIKIER